MKKSLGFLLVLLISAFFLIQCKSSSGGDGADFDSTQYYTKTEVNYLLPTVASEKPKTFNAANAGYATGLPFNNAANKQIVMFFLMPNSNWTASTTLTSEVKFYCGVSDTSASYYSFQPGGFNGIATLVFPLSYTGTYRFWMTGTGANDIGGKIDCIPLWINNVGSDGKIAAP